MIAKPEGFIIMDYKTKLQTPATYFIQLKCYVLEGYSNHWFDIFDEQKCLMVQVNEVHFCLSSSQTELLSRAEGMVKETSEYRCLQSQFSVLYNESLILKAQLDETRARLNTTRTARLRQLEHMEASVCVHFCSSLSA